MGRIAEVAVAASNSRGTEIDGITIRPAGPCDADAIASLVKKAFALQSIPVTPPPSALGETTERVLNHFAAAAGGGLVAEMGRTMAACCLWSVSGRAMQLTRLAVEPSLRRRGIALSVLRRAESAARTSGLERIRLSTRIPLIGNRQLFARAGFEEVALRAHPGFTEPTFVEMELRL